MLRNSEFRRLLIYVSVPSLLFTVVGFILSVWTGLLVLACSCFIIAATVVFTIWRYRQIEHLSEYLKHISNGNYNLDVRDNAEGELSILKNEIYKVTVMLNRQNEALQADKAALQNALSDISHQLKTPLTSMFVMTDLLLEQDLPDQKRLEFTDRIRVQLERLQWLVTSLLKLSRLDAKTVEFKPESILAQQLFEKACGPLLIPLELKNQRLTIQGQDIKLRCDANWTAEALLNILKNCVEHTPQNGSISISCTQNPLFVQIQIRDSGAGIDPKDLPHIFERFYRGKNAADDSIGIGLAIASAIVQEQGGSIDASNAADVGSCFVIRFPKEPVIQ